MLLTVENLKDLLVFEDLAFSLRTRTQPGHRMCFTVILLS